MIAWAVTTSGEPGISKKFVPFTVTVVPLVVTSEIVGGSSYAKQSQCRVERRPGRSANRFRPWKERPTRDGRSGLASGVSQRALGLRSDVGAQRFPTPARLGSGRSTPTRESWTSRLRESCLHDRSCRRHGFILADPELQARSLCRNAPRLIAWRSSGVSASATISRTPCRNSPSGDQNNKPDPISQDWGCPTSE